MIKIMVVHQKFTSGRERGRREITERILLAYTIFKESKQRKKWIFWIM